VATYQGKIHGRKSVLGVYVARGKFGKITGDEITRFYCKLADFFLHYI